MPETIKLEIEDDKARRPGLYRHKWLGEPGSLEQRIYRDWQPIDEIPTEARLIRRWLDYGYSNDPTAVGDIYKWNDAYILDEQLYQKGLQNRQIAEFIKNLPQTTIAADSAEPKSNDEMALYGLTVIPARKGQGSVNTGIQNVQNQKIFYTKRSVNIAKEYRNYLWMTDKDGKIINEPSPIWNHHMDGIRYAFDTIILGQADDVGQKLEQQFAINRSRQELNSTR